MLSFINYANNAAFTTETRVNDSAFGPMPAHLKKPLLGGLSQRVAYRKLETKLTVSNVRMLRPHVNAVLGVAAFPAGHHAAINEPTVPMRASTNTLISPFMPGVTNVVQRISASTPNIGYYVKARDPLRVTNKIGTVDSWASYTEEAIFQTINLSSADPANTSEFAPSQVWVGPSIPYFPLVRSAQFDIRSQYAADRAYSANIRSVARNAWRSVQLEYQIPAEWYYGAGGVLELEQMGIGTEVLAARGPTTQSATEVLDTFSVETLSAPDNLLHGVLTGISSTVLRRTIKDPRGKEAPEIWLVRLTIESCV